MIIKNISMNDNVLIEENENYKVSLSPWVGVEPKILILGTMPSDVSLQAQAYYSNVGKNSFWKIINEQFPKENQDQGNREYITSLGIALWDCIHAGVRYGSLDSNIDVSTLEPNDIPGFLKEHPSISVVVFNGKKSAQMFVKYFAEADIREGIECYILPSTSNANAVSFTKKLEKWKILQSCLANKEEDGTECSDPLEDNT